MRCILGRCHESGWPPLRLRPFLHRRRRPTALGPWPPSSKVMGFTPCAARADNRRPIGTRGWPQETFACERSRNVGPGGTPLFARRRAFRTVCIGLAGCSAKELEGIPLFQIGVHRTLLYGLAGEPDSSDCAGAAGFRPTPRERPHGHLASRSREYAAGDQPERGEQRVALRFRDGEPLTRSAAVASGPAAGHRARSCACISAKIPV